jgi:hypothetical protein
MMGYTFEGWTVTGGNAGTCTGKTKSLEDFLHGENVRRPLTGRPPRIGAQQRASLLTPHTQAKPGLPPSAIGATNITFAAPPHCKAISAAFYL